MAGQLHGRRLTAKKNVCWGSAYAQPGSSCPQFLKPHGAYKKKKSPLNNPALHQNFLLCGAQVPLIYSIWFASSQRGLWFSEHLRRQKDFLTISGQNEKEEQHTKKKKETKKKNK